MNPMIDNPLVDASKAATGIGRLLETLKGSHPADPFTAPQTPFTQSQDQGQTGTTGPESVNPVGSADYNISSPFGQRGSGNHPGIDIAVPVGTPILAATSGTVTHAAGDDPGGYGNWVEVTGADGTVTRYGHLSGISVKAGAKVSAGSPIGASGGAAGAAGSGNSTGPHLHFEVRPGGGAPTDPASFLAGGWQIVGEGAVPTQGDASQAPKTPEAAAAAGVNKVTDVLAGNPVEDPTQTQESAGGPEGIDAFLAATKQHESGGDYKIYNQSGLSDASGAYQFISTTWNNYGGYRNAADAPPEVQDRKAREMATALYNKYHDWRLVAIAWYGGPGIADQVAAGKDPGSPQGQGPYLAYGDTIVRMMGGR